MARSVPRTTTQRRIDRLLTAVGLFFGALIAIHVGIYLARAEWRRAFVQLLILAIGSTMFVKMWRIEAAERRLKMSHPDPTSN